MRLGMRRESFSALRTVYVNSLHGCTLRSLYGCVKILIDTAARNRLVGTVVEHHATERPPAI